MDKTIGIMQPYFLPYVGYFQLINLVDEFVVYDNIQYTKKGWINRNRMLSNGKDLYFTLPLKKDSDFPDIKDRELSETFEIEKLAILRRIKESYKKSPFYSDAFPVIEACFNYTDRNLFNFILNSLKEITSYLEIKTPIIISSSIEMNHSLKNQERVVEICKKLNATRYINPIGGVELYEKNWFQSQGVTLDFLRAGNVLYRQGCNDFIPYMSILDIMMFNSKSDIQRHLLNFTIE